MHNTITVPSLNTLDKVLRRLNPRSDLIPMQEMTSVILDVHVTSPNDLDTEAVTNQNNSTSQEGTPAKSHLKQKGRSPIIMPMFLPGQQW